MIEYFLLVYLAIGSGSLAPRVELYNDYDTAQKWVKTCQPDEHCSVWKVTQKVEPETTSVELNLLTNKTIINSIVVHDEPTIEEVKETTVAAD